MLSYTFNCSMIILHIIYIFVLLQILIYKNDRSTYENVGIMFLILFVASIRLLTDIGCIMEKSYPPSKFYYLFCDGNKINKIKNTK